MSARQYSFSGSTADGIQELTSMADFHERGYVAIRFYTDAALTNLTTPTAGVVTVTVSESGDIFGSISNGNDIDATNIGPSTQYLRPNWAGASTHLRLEFTNIASADYFKCDVSRFGGF